MVISYDSVVLLCDPSCSSGNYFRSDTGSYLLRGGGGGVLFLTLGACLYMSVVLIVVGGQMLL